MSNPSVQPNDMSGIDQVLKTIESVAQNTAEFDPDDVPLDETGNAQVGIRSGSQKFEGSEHRAIGDNANLWFMVDGQPTAVPSDNVVLKTISGADLTYGRTISMAGDFYTNRGKESLKMYEWNPISGAYSDKPQGTPESRFNDMVTCILTDYGGYVKALKEALDQEKLVVDTKKGADGGNEARAYHSGEGMASDIRFTTMTSGRYPRMAYQNADHFGNDALFCYKVGHALACQAAIKAGLSTSSQDRDALLKTAYFIEATSNHYLTDLFSSGHGRTPRRAFHYDSYLTMAQVGPTEVPLWDTMARFMHDDDSATGLLYKNAAGEQWIAFGDKQLFMPANGNNRVRCVQTVQTSINEVFSYFQNPKTSDNQVKQVSHDTKFNTLDLIPTIIPNCRSDDPLWTKTVMESPAPLWVPDKNEMSKTQPWTYRKQNDNHAAYILEKGHPGFKYEDAWFDKEATAEGYAIKAAPFRGDDQFPFTQAVETNTGLLQLGQTGSTWLNPDDKGDSVFAACWSPIRFPKVTYDSIPKSITLRSRQDLSDQYNSQGASTLLVHAMGWFDGSKTVAILVRQPLSDVGNPSSLRASAYSFTDPNQGQADQFNMTPGTKQSAVTLQTLWLNKPLFANLSPPSTSVSMMELRCFKFTDKQLPRPFLASAISDVKGVYYSRTYLDNADNTTGIFSTDWTKKSSASEPDWPTRPFVKAWRGSSKNRALLFCQHSATNNSFAWRASMLQLTDPDNGNDNIKWWPNWPQDNMVTLRCPSTGPYNKIRSACFLVGNIIGAPAAGSQCGQIATVTMSPTYTQFDIFSCNDPQNSAPTSKAVCKHDCADDPTHGGPGGTSYDGSGYLRDYLIGLVSSQSGAEAGSDIVHISLHKVGGKYHLKFKTHVNNNNNHAKHTNGATGGGVDECFTGCNVSWIPDDLMSQERYESGRYQSLKWLYMPHVDTVKHKHAIMEVFSWYGVLGFRYFAATWDSAESKYDFALVGVQPYNGQASMTVGRGFYGTWGEGFIPMYSTQDFGDVNHYNMVLGGETGQGYWDSRSKDTVRWNENLPSNQIRRESDYIRGLPGDMTKLEK